NELPFRWSTSKTVASSSLPSSNKERNAKGVPEIKRLLHRVVVKREHVTPQIKRVFATDTSPRYLKEMHFKGRLDLEASHCLCQSVMVLFSSGESFPSHFMVRPVRNGFFHAFGALRVPIYGVPQASTRYVTLRQIRKINRIPSGKHLDPLNMLRKHFNNVGGVPDEEPFHYRTDGGNSSGKPQHPVDDRLTDETTPQKKLGWFCVKTTRIVFVCFPTPSYFYPILLYYGYGHHGGRLFFCANCIPSIPFPGFTCF
ncbi:hypothetical protein TNIN_489011, partial [Trichonephila inaurata madagascariensis]